MIFSLPATLALAAFTAPSPQLVNIQFESRQYVSIRYWEMIGQPPPTPGGQPPVGSNGLPCTGPIVDYDGIYREFIMAPDGTNDSNCAFVRSRLPDPAENARPQDELAFRNTGTTLKYRGIALRFEARFDAQSDPLLVEATLTRVTNGSPGASLTQFLRPTFLNKSTYVPYIMTLPAPQDGVDHHYSVQFKLHNVKPGCRPAIGNVKIRNVGLLAATRIANNMTCFSNFPTCTELNGCDIERKVVVAACGDQLPLDGVAWQDGYCDFDGDGHITPNDEAIFDTGFPNGDLFFDLNHDGMLSQLDVDIMDLRLIQSCGTVYPVYACPN